MTVIPFPETAGRWLVVAQRVESGTQVLWLAGPVESLVLLVTADVGHAWQAPSLAAAQVQARRFEEALGGFWIGQAVTKAQVDGDVWEISLHD